MTAGRALALLLVSALAAACSQRVTPEEEATGEDGDRRVLSPAEAASAAGRDVPVASPGAGGAEIRGTLRLAEGARVPAGAVVFVLVRAADATGGPPLAVQRRPAGAFPAAFAIGPRDAMTATAPFPDAVRVEARVDADGVATTREPGDLSATSDPVAPGATGLELVLRP